MVRHLHIGPKMSSLEPPEDLSQIWSNSVEKFEPPEQPLLEVRRFFQWCQEMPLGILMRFQAKKVQYFFWDFNFCWTFQRLLQHGPTIHSSSSGNSFGPFCKKMFFSFISLCSWPQVASPVWMCCWESRCQQFPYHRRQAPGLDTAVAPTKSVGGADFSGWLYN